MRRSNTSETAPSRPSSTAGERIAVAIRTGSGGAGAHRGGDGVVRDIEFLTPMARRDPLEPAARPSGSQAAPMAPAACGRNYIVRANGTIEELPGTAEFARAAGDRIVIETHGRRRGWGTPIRWST